MYENEAHSEILTWDARFPALPLNIAVRVFRFYCSPIFSHLWESTQKRQPVSRNLLEPLMLKGYWIGLGRARGWACDSKAGPQLAYRCPRAAPHLEVVWDPCALPLGAFSVAPIPVSEQFPHHLPNAGAGGLTEFQGAAPGDLLCQLTFKMLKYVHFGGHSRGPILRTTSHHHPLSHQLIHSVIISGKYFVQLFPHRHVDLSINKLQ